MNDQELLAMETLRRALDHSTVVIETLTEKNERLREEYADLAECHDEHYRDFQEVCKENARLRQQSEDHLWCEEGLWFCSSSEKTIRILTSKIERLQKACEDFISHLDSFGGTFFPAELNTSINAIRAALEGDE